MTELTLTELRPFRLEPQFVERVWGRTSLAPWYSVHATGRIGEAWLTGHESLVATGDFAGRTLGEAVAGTGGAIGADGDFPLLVKMLFPDEKLSVQVHPDDDQAREQGGRRGKTECWYVLAADPGAQVACGLRPGVTTGELAAGARAGTAEDLLAWLPVAPGDLVYVDAGTVHAIGPGMTLLEVQQTCDTTYRLYDYGRPRELHLEQGLRVVKTETRAGKVKPQDHGQFTRLIESPYFILDRFEVPAGQAFELAFDSLGCVVGLKGAGAIDEVKFSAGQAVVAPRGPVTLSTVDGCTFVRICEPSTNS